MSDKENDLKTTIMIADSVIGHRSNTNELLEHLVGDLSKKDVCSKLIMEAICAKIKAVAPNYKEELNKTSDGVFYNLIRYRNSDNKDLKAILSVASDADYISNMFFGLFYPFYRIGNENIDLDDLNTDEKLAVSIFMYWCTNLILKESLQNITVTPQPILRLSPAEKQIGNSLTPFLDVLSDAKDNNNKITQHEINMFIAVMIKASLDSFDSIYKMYIDDDDIPDNAFND